MAGFHADAQEQAEEQLREKYATLIARCQDPNEQKALQAELKQKIKELRKSFY
jgi:hypothetical protein